MCDFGSGSQEEAAQKKILQTMGYCYISPDGYKTKKYFEYW